MINRKLEGWADRSGDNGHWRLSVTHSSQEDGTLREAPVLVSSRGGEIIGKGLSGGFQKKKWARQGKWA